MRARAAVLIAGLALVAGCSSRPHSNPFDPKNPETGGRPSGFVALAENTFVRLQWSPSTAPGLVGFELRRRIAGEPDYLVLPLQLPANSSGFVDLGLSNGTTYEYQLYHVFQNGPGGLPAEDRATPGLERAWATDPEAGMIARMTPDGRHIAAQVAGFSAPYELAVDDYSGVAWVGDIGDGSVSAVLPDGRVSVQVTGFSRPAGLAIDWLDRGLWVCDQSADLLRHLQPSGQPGTPSSIGGLDEPLAVAIDPADRSVWVTEHHGNQVRRFSVAGAQLGRTAVTLPWWIAIDSLTRDVWVSSYEQGQVVRMNSSMVPQDTIAGFLGPIGIDIDPRRGRVWIADAVASEVVVLDRAGAVLFRVRGLPGARSVSLDLKTGDAWVVATSLGRVAHVSSAGTVLESAGGFVSPRSVAVDRSGP